MRFSIPSLAIILTSLLSFTFTSFTQNTQPASKENKMPVFCQEFSGQLKFVESRLIELGEAIPENVYSWRPGEGVRSFGEVYRHITQGNYGLFKWAGYDIPETANYQEDQEKWEKEVTTKKEILAALEKSFGAVQDLIKSLNQEELDETLNVFGREMSRRGLLIAIFGHIHEHFGQAIAYARINKIVPPWTAREKQKAKDNEN